ncbi:isocitrate/isopropylmalate family dehydrogenase [Haliangium sp. UPWRP_2]|uniref:isocitrate/isopropylmalate dehydrogenase family protein n=1 Tax=Haliangium sp. UPWRP_2 TaxID=1931276 RepID=UPI000B544F11|nr:isocitrate/isopropylmalate family dehydrogenase [Haliangium sp. UPWRP_2]PSM31934.1 NAD-dependent isocitrate dehydrogenase [Haliangium sp. UPWRP_2]
MSTQDTEATAPLVSLIRGDGIGPEISEATLAMLEAAGAKLRWEEVPAGVAALPTHHDPLPEITLASIEKTKVALKGPLSTPKGTGFRSVNVALRQHFDLYVNLRPAKSIAGVPSRYEKVDIVTVRENTEDIYAGIEHFVGPGRSAAESIAVITRHGSERIVRYAFEYARKHGRKKVSIIHKANILKMSNGLFLEVGKEVAKQFPDIESDDVIVDAACMKLVLMPERFDVIVTMNLFGDILSDLIAGLVGGLGVSPGANLGERAAIFEAVHGSAPDIAGQGIANPSALLMAALMMLEHLGQHDPAARLRAALFRTLADPRTRTRDLGGQANTQAFTQAVIAQL